jgi:hypothetical protein
VTGLLNRNRLFRLMQLFRAGIACLILDWFCDDADGQSQNGTSILEIARKVINLAFCHRRLY